MLSELISKFEVLCATLSAAVRGGNDALVSETDAQLAPLFRRIFDHGSQCPVEVQMQIAFFSKLAVDNCEDDTSVKRNTDFMIALFNRYLAASTGAQPVAARPTSEASGLPAEGYDTSIHELALDSVPERIAVVSRDYRYIYCNENNARFHNLRPFDFIGRHLAEQIGEKSFHARAKAKLDQCFEGAVLFYDYEIADSAGRYYDVKCRMTPLSGPAGAVIGAVIVLQMQPLFARVS